MTKLRIPTSNHTHADSFLPSHGWIERTEAEELEEGDQVERETLQMHFGFQKDGEMILSR